MKTKIVILISFICFPFAWAKAQDTSTKKQKKWAYTRIAENGTYLRFLSEGIQYTTFNFFTGPDAENFKTTMKGFGSIGSTYEMYLAKMGGKHFDIFLNLGASLRYYRFEENLQLTRNADNITATIVENPPYKFKNTFFSWSKNKMVLGYLTVPFGFDIKTSVADLRVQASYIRYISGKHKLKYNASTDVYANKGDVTLDWLVGDERNKYKTPNKEFKNYFLNKNNLSFAVMLTPKFFEKPWFRIGATYDVNPLFMEDKGPDIHETSIVVCFDLDE